MEQLVIDSIMMQTEELVFQLEYNEEVERIMEGQQTTGKEKSTRL